MIKKDIENEMKISCPDDTDTEDAQSALDIQAEKELAAAEEQIADTEDFNQDRQPAP